MDDGYFWLSEDQFRRLGPHLPTDTRGKPRVDDRRVISDIIHVLTSGRRWIATRYVIGSRETSSIPFISRPSSHIGYESGPWTAGDVIPARSSRHVSPVHGHHAALGRKSRLSTPAGSPEPPMAPARPLET